MKQNNNRKEENQLGKKGKKGRECKEKGRQGGKEGKGKRNEECEVREGNKVGGKLIHPWSFDQA